MTINKVAETLNTCAEGNCIQNKCKYRNMSINECRDKLIVDMAAECKKIAEEGEKNE